MVYIVQSDGTPVVRIGVRYTRPGSPTLRYTSLFLVVLHLYSLLRYNPHLGNTVVGVECNVPNLCSTSRFEEGVSTGCCNIRFILTTKLGELNPSKRGNLLTLSYYIYVSETF